MVSDATEDRGAAGPPGDPHPVPAIAAGLLVDLVDLSLAGPLGIAGAVIAAALVWWIAGQRRIERTSRLAVTAAAAIYCALPMTELVPLGTVVGAAITFMEWRRGRRGGRAASETAPRDR